MQDTAAIVPIVKCIIIDDEQQSIDGLTAMLTQRFAHVCVVVAAHTNPLEAPALLHRFEPHIMFLDVEMPRITGIDLLKMIPDRKCQVVFTTAYAQYALEAIKLQAADYLVKPYSIEELGDALQRCLHRLQVNQLLAIPQDKQGPVRFAITAQNGLHFIVSSHDIVWVEAVGNYSNIYFTDRPRVMVSKTLKEYEDQLAGHGFFRAHSSSLVNMMHVKTFHAIGHEDYLLLSNGDKVPLSRRRKSAFFERVQKI